MADPRTALSWYPVFCLALSLLVLSWSMEEGGLRGWMGVIYCGSWNMKMSLVRGCAGGLDVNVGQVLWCFLLPSSHDPKITSSLCFPFNCMLFPNSQSRWHGALIKPIESIRMEVVLNERSWIASPPPPSDSCAVCFLSEECSVLLNATSLHHTCTFPNIQQTVCAH